MIFGLLLAVFLLVCIFLCLLVLIQSDKGGGLSGTLGGLSGASSFLGTQDTANVLTKGTYIFGGAFLLLCVLMTFFAPGTGSGISKSGMQKRAEKVQTVAPAITPGIMGFGEAAEEAAQVLPGLIQEESVGESASTSENVDVSE
ncbi:MAG: preprotein translocase subunit SecG [Chitinispirillales bacterium]|jgi:preprotein translocase subunit SecG|nr:preprotein translocase subunit SecG [Chitinispirillales bacterium]